MTHYTRALDMATQKWINLLKPSLNSRNVYVTEEEKKTRAKEYNVEYQKKRYDCDCGKNVQLCKKTRHERTLYHIKNVT